MRRSAIERVHRALEEVRAGRMVILVDDEDRENEGDLTMAAEKVTPEAINFMAKWGRGLICLPLEEEQVERLERTTWPTHDVPMQMHLDFTVSTLAELQRQRERAESLGAQLLLDRTDSDEPLYVLADPSGHPFCILVA